MPRQIPFTVTQARRYFSPGLGLGRMRMTISNMTRISNNSIHDQVDVSTSTVASGSKQGPVGYTVHREASAEVLLADGRDVFINPIQEFNRDLSSLTIRTWSELVNEEKQLAWERKKQAGHLNKGKKRKHEDAEVADGTEEPSSAIDGVCNLVAILSQTGSDDVGSITGNNES